MAKVPSLAKLAAKWRDRLGLSHWDLTLRYCAPAEMDHKGASGEVDWDGVRRTALIRILHPKFHDDRPQYAYMRDVEYLVVHELCHCVIGPITADDADYMRRENVVDDLAHALLKSERGG